MELFDLTPEEKVESYLIYNKKKPSQEGFMTYEPSPQPLDVAPKPVTATPRKEFRDYLSDEPMVYKPKDNTLSEFHTDMKDMYTQPTKIAKKMEEKNKTEFNPGKFKLNASQKAVIDSIKQTPYSEESKDYLTKLAYYESKYDPTVINQFGYAGLYQFGKSAFEWVGIKKEDYMNDVNKQHEAALSLGNKNFSILKKYLGRVINGVPATKQGLMAAAHLGGAGNVKKYFESEGKNDFKDGNGLPVSAYLKRFS